METTNQVINSSLYEFLTTESLLYWVRVTVATRMATTGPEWVNYFSKYNSGT